MQPLHYAAKTGKAEIIKYLVDSCNVPITVTALVSCIACIFVWVWTSCRHLLIVSKWLLLNSFCHLSPHPPHSASISPTNSVLIVMLALITVMFYHAHQLHMPDVCVCLCVCLCVCSVCVCVHACVCVHMCVCVTSCISVCILVTCASISGHLATWVKSV